MSKRATVKVPSAPAETPMGKRAVDLGQYLTRWVPFWGHPGWLAAERWRAFVRNQPIATVCRDTLIQNVLSMPYTVVARNPEDAQKSGIRKAAEYYTELLDGLEGDFDTYIELMCQDMLDLPFGAAAEVGREDDDAEGPVLWMEHIDAATLMPTGDPEYPVTQRVQEMPGTIVNFPKHAIERMYVSPRTEIMRRGWGMAPPEKIYLAMEMLFRGDRYYANLLLDTPEAGILDLIDMNEDSANKWLESWRGLFEGIDGMKVPVLHSHTKPAVWIPLNRPPTDLIYDKTTLKYAQILAAGYGMRLSDIGLDEMGGEKTLAGVIRGERATKRSGFAQVKTKLENHFNRILPKELMFHWLDMDQEAIVARGQAIVAIGQGLTALKAGGFIDQKEGRAELIATGLMQTDLDPNVLPEEPQEAPGFPFGGPKDKDGKPIEKPKEKGKVPVSDGGRGGATVEKAEPEFPGERRLEELRAELNGIVQPGLALIAERAEPPRLRRLIKAVTRALLPEVQRTFTSLTDDQVWHFWLPEMSAIDFDQPSEIDSLVVRQSSEEIKRVLDAHLIDDPWFEVATEWEKAQILRIFASAYAVGLEDMALGIIRSLYEEGLRSSPELLGLSFNLTNRRTLRLLEERAAELVTNVDAGTKTFVRRVVVAGTRQGLASPTIAQAIREGASAEAILTREGFIEDVVRLIQNGLIEMTETRANSIVNTEISRAENEGKLAQIAASGMKFKSWVHLGKRGVTKKGNIHPCPVCEGNEKLGLVPIDYVYRTVFPEGAQTPPGHPSVCHCAVQFSEQEMLNLGRDYRPWTGK